MYCYTIPGFSVLNFTGTQRLFSFKHRLSVSPWPPLTSELSGILQTGTFYVLVWRVELFYRPLAHLGVLLGQVIKRSAFRPFFTLHFWMGPVASLPGFPWWLVHADHISTHSLKSSTLFIILPDFSRARMFKTAKSAPNSAPASIHPRHALPTGDSGLFQCAWRRAWAFQP